MTATRLLTRIRELDGNLSLEGDRLRLSLPRGALTRELEEQLARWKPDLVRLLRAPSGRPGTPIGRAPRDEALRLSSFQERMWILHRLDPGSTAYHLAAWLEVEAPWDEDAAAGAASDLVRRHEILRTTYVEAEGEPVARIGDPRPLRPRIVDLRDRGAEDADRELTALAEREARRPLDLSREAPFRPLVVRLGPELQAFMVVLHHIVTDAWSMGLALHEWESLYRARLAGSPPAAEPPRLQYADYAAWQRASLAREEPKHHLDDALDRLAGAPTVLNLPFDRPRQPTQSFDGGVHLFDLDAETSERLARVCSEEGLTPFMVWVAAFGILLSRYSGQRDLLVGTPAAARNRPELEAVLGPFVNTMVIRHRQEPEDTSAELLARTREAVLAAHRCQDVPFERLVEALEPERSLAHPPLFQVSCAYHNAPGRADFTATGGGSMYELTLNGFETHGRVHGSFEYARSLFDEATIARAADHFRVVLKGLLSDRDRRVDALPILPAGEGRLLSETWQGAAVEWPEPFLLVDRFESRAARHPDRVAAAFGRERLSYGELDRRADRFARRLRDHGVVPGATVGILVERSMDLVVAGLGVMKAGGAYVPLDPAYPRARLAHILEDSGAVLVVEDAEAAESPGWHGLPVLRVGGAAEGAGEPVERLPRSGGPDDLAYVIYTSGTTGKPKGVEVTHGGLANVLRSLEAEPGLGPEDVLLAVTTFAFDIAGVELWLPLAAGGTVVVAPQEATHDGRRLLEMLETSGATVMQATPATWQMLIDAGWATPADGPRLRAWSGGEALTRELADGLLARAAEVWNLYGPTETTIWSTVARVRPGRGPVSIGRPLANTRVYVVGDRTGLTPTGVPGELLIGGAGVARGYRNLPGLTAERFVDFPGLGRLYRTGDRVRWSADGEILYEGRLDHQVKVRGHRIELGEIESVLATRPSVRMAAARVWDARIAAYVVFHEGREETASDLRRFLRDHLPEYMVPSFIVPLTELPLTENRKVDRKRLPDPAQAGVSRPREVEPPQGPVETAIAAVWAELLGSEVAVGAHDNFFELGGHSLLALKAAYRIEHTTGVRLDPRAMFFESLRQLASRLAAAAAEGPGAAPAVAAGGTMTPAGPPR